VRLLYSFQDKEYLYLGMEYVPGGNLQSLLENLEFTEVICFMILLYFLIVVVVVVNVCVLCW
jgi:serine/threonine protein kinase